MIPRQVRDRSVPAPATTGTPIVVTTPRLRLRKRIAKRLFDLVVATALLVLVLPVLAVVWLAVRLTSPGDAIYRQSRIGRDGRPFLIYKFRTMYAKCDDAIHRAYVTGMLTGDEPQRCGSRGLYKIVDDPRITRVGKFLRRASLDELPQLINVICGAMSLVGPRPALEWEVALFAPEHHRRFLVAPGLTGLWQVNGRSRLTMKEGLELDLKYVEKQSLFLDIVILAKTVPAVFTSNGI